MKDYLFNKTNHYLGLSYVKLQSAYSNQEYFDNMTSSEKTLMLKMIRRCVKIADEFGE